MSETTQSIKELVLSSKDLVAGYLPGVDILTGCNFDLFKGELVGIIGPNGAGKSTLVKSMFGLVEVRSGTVELMGEKITNLAAHELVKKGVGFVPQNENVFPSLTVAENLEMGAYQLPKAEVTARIRSITDLFPRLGERIKQRAGLLSGGERQMLAMGRALMMEPQVLLLDEPSAGLSPALQVEVFENVTSINQTGVSIVMVEQNATRCLKISDRGYVLDQGKNAYDGTGQDLLNDPNVIKLYLGTLAQS
ncbi:MAG: ABC transporter ATP-binding protein [Acidimicrobiales bacterium]|nr:ABC transporter ATP-binding protein [Acidimicrobiales bacterium]MDG1846890.1 ABC transporter ATP-binding protein [Acidimicrobiales bacterium]